MVGTGLRFLVLETTNFPASNGASDVAPISSAVDNLTWAALRFGPERKLLVAILDINIQLAKGGP